MTAPDARYPNTCGIVRADRGGVPQCATPPYPSRSCSPPAPGHRRTTTPAARSAEAWTAAPVQRVAPRPEPQPSPVIRLGPAPPRGARAGHAWPARYAGDSGGSGLGRNPFVSGQDLIPLRR